MASALQPHRPRSPCEDLEMMKTLDFLFSYLYIVNCPATALTDVVSEVVVRVVLLLDLLALNAVDEDWSVALRPLRNVDHSD